MAAATAVVLEEEEEDSHVVSCCNCLEVEGYILNPKVLPCEHIFCEKCLNDHDENAKDITCYICE